jgi:hypothetical protein
MANWTEEKSMTTLYEVMRQTESRSVPRELGIVILFCLLGLTISLAVLPGSDASSVGFVLDHLE